MTQSQQVMRRASVAVKVTPQLMLVIGAIILLLPALVAPIPPMSDYPNHLARMWLLSGGADLPGVRDIYRIRWDTLTNIAIDLVGATVGRVFSYEVAGRLSVAAAIVLPPLGGVVLWRSVHGRWHWWMLAFGLLAWGQSLLSGFLNFQIGLGAALLFAAADGWVQTRHPVWQLAIRSILAAILLVAHPFALIFYAALVAALVWGPELTPSWRRMGWQALLIGGSLVITGLVFLLLTPSLPGTQEHSGLSTLSYEFHRGLWDFQKGPLKKLSWAFLAFRGYDMRLDVLTGAALLLPVALAAANRSLRLHAGMLLATGALCACYFAFPPYLLGAYWVDTRFAIMAPFALVVALVPNLPRLLQPVCAALLSVVCVARTGSVAMIWQDRQVDIASVALALEAVPSGAKLLPLEHRPLDPSDAPIGRYMNFGETSFRHLSALGLPWRHVFVPIIFAARGKQPIETQPPWSDITNPNGGEIADIHMLDDPEVLRKSLSYSPYVAHWREHFDYVIVLNADVPDRAGPLAPIPALSLVRDEGFARVYRIEPP